MAQLNDTQVNGNLHVTEDVQIGDMSVTEKLDELNTNIEQNISNISETNNKLIDLIKLVEYNDGISRTLSASAGIYAGYTAPTYDGYTCLGCVGGHGSGQIGLIVASNGWVFNSSNTKKTFTNIVWYLLYIRN